MLLYDKQTKLYTVDFISTQDFPVASFESHFNMMKIYICILSISYIRSSSS